MIKQRTIASEATAIGTGIHNGKEVQMTLIPAPCNHGIVFKRLDAGGKLVRAHNAMVNEVVLSTGIEEGGVKISTVEHLLSALSAMGVDNLLIEINSFEVPIMDGSSAPFIFLLQSAGIKKQEEAKKFFVIKKEIEVNHNDCWAKLSPYHGFKISLKIDFDHKKIKESNQELTIDFNSESYLKEISRARTFGKISDVEKLQKQNLALGANMTNAIALSDDDILNEEGTRYDNEFVKHKILDIVGDMYLLGYNLIGYYQGFKSGHMLNDKLLGEVLSDKNNYEIREFKKEELNINFYTDD
jgi:UDP-3-O-[3-hydroxymyristoyl] N-acetylglucosamine deacetylase